MTASVPNTEREQTDDEIIGERVHQVMWRLKISQTEMAGKLGLDQSSVSNKLRGKRPFFARELVHVAEILNVSITDLLPERKGPRHPGDAGPEVGRVGLEPTTSGLIGLGSANVDYMAPYRARKEARKRRSVAVWQQEQAQ